LTNADLQLLYRFSARNASVWQIIIQTFRKFCLPAGRTPALVKLTMQIISSYTFLEKVKQKRQLRFVAGNSVKQNCLNRKDSPMAQTILRFFTAIF
jgi:hypothetical protein